MRNLFSLLTFGLILALIIEARAQHAGGCPVFPAENPWNQDITNLPIDPHSATWVAKINTSKTKLHPDWGSPRPYGIPYTLVGANQPLVQISFDPGNSFPDESDKGPWPIPPNAMVEGDSTDTGYEDFHVVVIDTDRCMLYELYHAKKDPVGTGWTVWSSAKFDLNKNYYRPDGWTSCDAAGLPIFPGLVRWNEVQAGEINHAVRFTVPKTQRGWIHPARHMASTTSDSSYPPMGARFRLQADFDESSYTDGALVIVKALKKYGMILADNGSAWFITGCHDDRWDDDNIGQLKNIPGSAFDVVYTGPVKHSPDPNAMIGVSPDTLRFVVPSAGTYTDTIEIANYGAQDLIISSIDAASADLTTSPPANIAPGATGSIVVTATMSTQDAMIEHLVIHSNDPATPNDTIPVLMDVQGGGGTLSTMVLDRDTVTFNIPSGVHGTYADTLRVSNTGTAPLTISNISASDPSLTWSGPTSISAGNSAPFVIRANMTTQNNLHARVMFSTNDPQHSRDTIGVYMNISNVGVGDAVPMIFEVRAYPNPALGAGATIECAISEPGIVELHVYSALGAQVASAHRTWHEAGRFTSAISSATLPNGIYRYRLTSRGRVATGQIVVSH